MYKKICTLVMGLTLFTLISLTMEVNARVDSYLIKDDQGKVYEYDYDELVKSYLSYMFDNSEGEDTAFYIDFLEKLKKFGYYSLHDDTGKYVNYKEIERNYLLNYETFNLNEFTEADNAPIVNISVVQKAKVENGKIVYKNVQLETGGNILTDIEEILGGKFFDADTPEPSGDFIGVDELTVLTIYDIEDESIKNLKVQPVDSKLHAIQNNTDMQLKIWTLYKSMIPSENRSYMAEVGFFTDGIDNTLAYVSNLEEDPDKWLVHIDIQDAYMGPTFIETIIHEHAHTFSLSYNQQEFNGEDYIYKKDSYYYQFEQTFWTEIQSEWEEEVNAEDSDSKLAFYEKHKDQFINDYCVTNVGEDLAETFAYFVLKPKPTGETVKDKKVLFFYQYPELVKLRTDILEGLNDYLKSGVKF